MDSICTFYLHSCFLQPKWQEYTASIENIPFNSLQLFFNHISYFQSDSHTHLLAADYRVQFKVSNLIGGEGEKNNNQNRDVLSATTNQILLFGQDEPGCGWNASFIAIFNPYCDHHLNKILLYAQVARDRVGQTHEWRSLHLPTKPSSGLSRNIIYIGFNMQLTSWKFAAK